MIKNDSSTDQGSDSSTNNFAFDTKKPKTIDELFHELEEYIMSDEDHRRRVVE
jgi:hypothetical protein